MSLDLYALPDDADLPADPTGLTPLGSLELREHAALRTIWDACADVAVLPYFEDSRLTHAELRQLHDCLAPFARNDGGMHSTLAPLLECLERALTEGHGLAAFCD